MLNNEHKLDGRYQVIKEIGSGGFGAVFLAEDTRFGGNNQVAIKKIVHTNERMTEAFRKEADLLFNLKHPNLPKVSNCFQENGAKFIVMEYITGEDLAAKLKKVKVFEVEEALNIAEKVLNALEYLHSFNIFHRDIKPANIKIDEKGSIFLLDFGTAKGSFDEEQKLNALEQSITGYTPFYAPLEQMLRVDANSYLLLQSADSPELEQFLDKRTDARSDIYSLGATLYHLLTGYSPENATATVRAFAAWSGKDEPLPHSQNLNSKIPDSLAHIIKRCMEILPKDRFQTANDLKQALKDINFNSKADLGLQNTIRYSGNTDSNQMPDIPQTEKFSRIENIPLPTEPFFEDSSVNEVSNNSISTNFKQTPLRKRNSTINRTLFIIGGFVSVFLILLFLLAGLYYYQQLQNDSKSSEISEVQTNSNQNKSDENGKDIDKPTNSEIDIDKDVRTMNYSLLVQKMREGIKYQAPFESSGQEVFENGYQFQMRFMPSDEGFLYVFNEGLNENNDKVLNIIFPTPIRNNGLAKVESKSKYESGWNEFSGTPGTENFWIIWSKDSNELLENVRTNSFESDTGELSDNNLKTQMKNFLDENNKYEKEISKNFKEQFSQIKFIGNTAVYLIKLEHR